MPGGEILRFAQDDLERKAAPMSILPCRPAPHCHSEEAKPTKNLDDAGQDQRGRPRGTGAGIVVSGGAGHHILSGGAGRGGRGQKALKKAGFFRKKLLTRGKGCAIIRFTCRTRGFFLRAFFPALTDPRRSHREAMPAESG